MASEFQKVEDMLEELQNENIGKIKHGLKEMYDIWSLVGVDDDQKLFRANNAWGYILDLTKELVKEEKGFYEDLKVRIKSYEQRILELSVELNIPKIKVEGALIEKEEILRKEVDNLSKLKHKRIKEFQELRSVELKYCQLLGMSSLILSSTTGVPSEQDINELVQQVNLLKAEKEHRLRKFQMLKKELTTIMEVTELPLETSLEKDLISSKECPSLSSETFEVLNQIVAKNKNKKADMEKEKKKLIERVTVLWDRLMVQKTERELFLSKHSDCRVSTLDSMKREISRCEEMKRQNIKQYIDRLKKELELLWEKCFVNESQKKNFISNTDCVSEDILDAYDQEVTRWRQYYNDVEHIIEKIEKRRTLWELMIVLENKASDPNRFKNRRGNLLQEERERKKIQRDLPMLENEIFEDIQKYEEEHGNLFLYFGEDFRVYVTQQWEERQAQKENKKIVRQKMRTKQIESEITLGATFKRQLQTTPKSAPSKLFKSTHGVAIYRTPGSSSLKIIPNTVAKFKTYKKPTSKPIDAQKDTNVLKDKNQNVAEGSGSNLEETTYSHFASKLNNSSRKAHRSSVLSSRKIVGTRTANTSRKKNGSKSSRKSTTKKPSTSKVLVTPARGKLGIPFII